MRFIFLFLIVPFGYLFARGQSAQIHEKGFIQNKGQILNQNLLCNNDILFLFAGKGIKIQLRKNGYSYEMNSIVDLPSVKAGKKFFEAADLAHTKIISSRVDIDFQGMNSNPEVVAEMQTEGNLNYITCGTEAYAVKSFRKVTFRNIYDNTDIEFTINENYQNPLKYNIILHPGADINKIKFLCKGANSIKRSGNDLKIITPLGEIDEKIPFSYYDANPDQNVPVTFKLENNLISFSCNYDASKSLVIDPTSNIIWSTYFGGSSLEYCSGAATDSQNDVYILGHTLSTSNIATNGVYQNTLNGNFDIYIAKFSSTGTFLWGTYFGGSNFEQGYAICIDSADNVYISGDSASPTNVASPGAHQTTYGGGIDDAILAKFDPNGQRIWSTYYGGTQHDFAYCLSTDKTGNVIIAGHTESGNTGNVIATTGSFKDYYSLNVDAFIAKFNGSGVRQWGTYFGDTGNEEALGVKADPENNIVITGFTSSIANISTPPCHQPYPGGLNDAYIAKFDPTGSNLIWATYYGGTGPEQGSAIDTGPFGNIYVGGNTGSSNAIATPGCYQAVPGNPDDVFVTCFDQAGVRQWGTYYGGGSTDYVFDLLLSPTQKVLICGETLSTNSISTAGAYQPSIGVVNTYDAYFAKFNSNGSALVLASYFGSDGNDYAKGIALDNAGLLYLAGETNSTYSMTTPGAYMPNPAGSGDAFVSKFCISPEPVLTPSASISLCMNQSYTVAVANTYSTYLWNTGAVTSSLAFSPTLTPGTYYYAVTVNDAFGCTGSSDSTKVIVNNCITGLHELQDAGQFKLFPVPAKDKVQVELPQHKSDEKTELRIYSSPGELMLKNELLDSKQIIDIGNLTPGIYLMEFYRSGVISVKKFIKE